MQAVIMWVNVLEFRFFITLELVLNITFVKFVQFILHKDKVKNANGKCICRKICKN